MDYSEMQRTSLMHVNDPKVGDYWHEMCNPVCIVKEVTKDFAIVIKPNREKQVWDEENPQALHKKEFKHWLSYNTDALKDKLWCDVTPELYAENFNEST